MSSYATQFEPRWTTKETANSVNISETTIRKYAQILERECKYKFHIVNEKGDRRFSDHDMTLFIDMKRLSDETGMNVASIAKMVMRKHGYTKTNTVRTEAAEEMNVSVVPQGFHGVVVKASRQFWTSARKEIVDDVREVVREEVKNELRVEMDDLKHRLAQIGEETRQVAASLEKQRIPWWKRRRK